MTVRTRGRPTKRSRPVRQPARPAPKPKTKMDLAKGAIKGTARVLGKIGDYIAKNQADFAKSGLPSFEEDMEGMVRRVGSSSAAHGRTERERIMAMCRRDSDEEICRYMTGRREPPRVPMEFVVEGRERQQHELAPKKRKRPQPRVTERIIYYIPER